ncbi:MAG: O-methyltransferase, partial [Bacilli bacterium]|nr:O-methyltransferase [Bacilli bacterium]
MVRIRELEEYAKTNNVPIMEKDGIAFLIDNIKKHDIKNILEIGTAIGYSSIMMALVNSNIKITTIERDQDRYLLAVDNINKFGLQEQIKIICGDALETQVMGIYDLIFIDAAKAQNIKFFEKYQDALKPGGVIVTDNLNFHGLRFADTNSLSKN